MFIIYSLPISVICIIYNLSKQIGHRSALTKGWAWSGSNLFETQMVFLKVIFKRVDFGKKISRRQKSMKNFQVNKQLRTIGHSVSIFWKVNFEKSQQTTIHEKLPSMLRVEMSMLTYGIIIFVLNLHLLSYQLSNSLDPNLFPMCLQRLYGPLPKKTCLWWFLHNKGANQPAHTRSLISAFVIS